MIEKLAPRRINNLAVATRFNAATPHVSGERNSQTTEKKACCECYENSHNTLLRVLRPLVQKILATPYRDGATSLDYAPILPVVRVAWNSQRQNHTPGHAGARNSSRVGNGRVEQRLSRLMLQFNSCVLNVFRTLYLFCP